MTNIAYAMGQGGGTSGSAGGFPLLIPLIIIGLFVWFIIIKRKKPGENKEFSSSQTMERSQDWMKKTGPILIVLGIIALLSSLSMNVGVKTGIYGQRMANIDLMNQRQNYVIVSSLILLIGVGITIIRNFIKIRSDQTPQENIRVGTKKCPYCAEMIQEEAIVCRYCNRDLEQTV